ncbi:MAG: ABC transporter substrate-binding protein [Hydrogenophaga sp.]|uniref:ABC transporter substrate-binding protein n=1 Tax=Hydrogenophaga sp. TaxID=1904254 RepID=UPI002624A6DD|nr:ABC transporter substrate-binding protein [Hydrogenophaga sp.]MCV0439630.1 ABC transporter substrate-binding protein [Hydrogenophaga sp.]
MILRTLVATLAAALLPAAALSQNTIQAGDIVVAQIGPFTVLPAPDPRELNEGIRAALDEINGRGGIQGRRVSLVSLDDTYTFDGFRQQLAVAMEKKPVALLTPLGSATLKGVLDSKLLDNTDIVILNAVPGASVLRAPGHPKLFHIRAGDEQQIHKIVNHARTLNIRSMGVLYQNIPIGSSGLASARAAAAELGGIDIVDAASSTDAAAIAKAASTLAAANPQSALVVGAPKFVGESIAALRAAGISQQIFTLSYLPAPALVKFAGEGARGVGIAQTYPNPRGATLPLQRDFRAAMAKAHPTLTAYTTFHMEGYVTARVFAEAARRSRSLTPTGIAQALHSMAEVDLGGFRVNFARSNLGSSWVDIGVVSGDGKLLY